MEHDPRPWRFFGYMNLFCAFMLALVLANDFLLLYLGWEGVGLCSYLLIGFWSDRPEAARAAKKAFITTRIGDVALMLGLFVMFMHFGSFDFDTVLGHEGSLPEIATGTATAISLLLLGGAVGKSAQLPLHVWLPDAMAGPTPVSALDPRGDDGDGRRVPRGARARAVRDLRGRAHRGGGRGSRGRPLRRARLDRAVRHEAGARVLDDVAARLHVPRGRARLLPARDLVARRARVLQGAAVPHVGQRDARSARRDRRAAPRRAAPRHAVDRRAVRGRRALALGPAAVQRLLHEGRDPRGREPRRCRRGPTCSARSARSSRPGTSRGCSSRRSWASGGTRAMHTRRRP